MGAVAEGDNSIGLHRVTQQRRHKSMPAPIRRHWARRHSQLPLGRAAHTRPLCTGICHVCARRIFRVRAPRVHVPVPAASANALRVSLEAIRDDAGTDTERDGWKLCLLAPRMLLFRTPGVAHVPPQEFKRREHLFCEGSWTQLLRESVAAAQPAQPVRDAVRAPESPQVGSESDIRRRADRASALAHLGEMSAAAKALTAPPLAPATAEMLQALRDPVRRPPEAQVPIHPSVDPMSAAPAQMAQVCKADLLINLRRARRGAAAGPSGCTNEHLRVLMDEETTAELLGHAADRLAAAKVPSDVADALRLGRMVALTKPWWSASLGHG